MSFPTGAVSAIPFIGNDPDLGDVLAGWNHANGAFPSFKDGSGNYATAGQANGDYLRLVCATRAAPADGHVSNTWFGPLLHKPAVYAILANALPTGYDNTSFNPNDDLGGECAYVSAHVTDRYNAEYPQDEGVFAGVGHFSAGFTGSPEEYFNTLKWVLKSPYTEGSIRLVDPGASHVLSIAVSGGDVTVTLGHNGSAVTTTAAQVLTAVQAHVGASAVVDVSPWQSYFGGTDVVTASRYAEWIGYAKLYPPGTPVLQLFIAVLNEGWYGTAKGPIAIVPLGAEPAAGAAIGLRIVGTTADLYYSASGGIAAFPSTPDLSIAYEMLDTKGTYFDGFYDPGFIGIGYHHIADDFELFSEVGAGDYPLDPLPTVSSLDTFTRADAGTLGGNWLATGTLKVKDNKVAAVGTSSTASFSSCWTGSATADNQAVKVTLTDALPAWNDFTYEQPHRGVLLRSTDGTDGYLACIYRGTAYGPTQAWLAIFENGNWGSPAAGDHEPPPLTLVAGPYPVDEPVPGSALLAARVVGGEVCLWYSASGALPDLPQLRGSSTTYTAGYPGLSVYGVATNGEPFDNFYAGDVSDGTISKTPSGGIVLGGSAAQTRTIAKSTSGGVVLGGSAAKTRAIARSASGGVVLGGSASYAKVRAFSVSGGIVLGGSASRTKTVTPATAGGIVLGGSAAETRSLVVSCSGGVVLGGTATQTRSLARTVSGGLVLGGTSTQTRSLAEAVSGGIVLGGSATASTSGAITKSPSGGIVLGGTSTQARTIAPAPTGGLALGGSAAKTRSIASAVSGGVVLGGTCTYTRSIAKTPSGGIILGGSTAQARSLARSPSGGLVLGGSATASASGVIFVNVTGGIVLGGSAALARAIAASCTGGIVLGGAASSSRAVSRSCTGGLVLGGSATATSSAGFFSSPAGGVVLGGSAVTTITRAKSPAGGVVLGGRAALDYSRTCTGGIVLGGSATYVKIGGVVREIEVNVGRIRDRWTLGSVEETCRVGSSLPAWNTGRTP